MANFYSKFRGVFSFGNAKASPASSLVLLFISISLSASAQYQQNFDTITTTGTSTYNNLPEGWAIYEVGSSTSADGRYSVSTGSNNAGNAYSFGASGSTDRALGSISSGTNAPTIGAIFFNETEDAINSVTISFTMEQWRYGGTSTTRPAGMKDIIPFSYSLDATSIANTAPGTFVFVPQLNMESVITSGTVLILDGNAAANRVTVSYTITGISIPSGGSILIRWADSDTPGSDDGLSIDNFSISAGLAPGVLTSGATNTGGGTGGGGGTTTNTGTSVPIFPHIVATDSSFLHLYGNLHGHSTYSDGRASTLTPADDFNYARTAIGMDFLGISEHNHSTAGMQIVDYKAGYNQAEATNGLPNAAGNPFLTFYGMEWGTISGGGHVLVYGFKDSLINWETGNYDILVAKSDYIGLFDTIRKRPNAFATLAHPNNGDFTGLTGGYKGVADSAVVSVAIESGPAFSTATNYSDYPSSLAYINYYKNVLKQGYRVAAQMDQDNHEMTFGTANGNRMVVLSKERTREALVRGIRAMRVYASNDYNAQLSFSMNGFIMGSQIRHSDNLIITVNHTDADAEALSAVQLWGGKVGGADATLLHTSTTNTTYMTNQALGETWYYYTVLTQGDGNKMVSAPIWLTREAAQAPLPVRLLDVTASIQNEKGLIKWSTAEEIDAASFAIERSLDGRTFTQIGSVSARGSNSSYQFLDGDLQMGTTYYRLRMIDLDGSFVHSKIVSVDLRKGAQFTMYPNPARSTLNIRTSILNKQLQVQIIDAAGNRVYNKMHSSASVISLNVSGFANGIYVVRVGDEIQTVIINK
jgi:hypothetical protein